jgi:hypothetical protein
MTRFIVVPLSRPLGPGTAGQRSDFRDSGWDKSGTAPAKPLAWRQFLAPERDSGWDRSGTALSRPLTEYSLKRDKRVGHETQAVGRQEERTEREIQASQPAGLPARLSALLQMQLRARSKWWRVAARDEHVVATPAARKREFACQTAPKD